MLNQFLGDRKEKARILSRVAEDVERDRAATGLALDKLRTVLTFAGKVVGSKESQYSGIIEYYQPRKENIGT